MSTIANVNTRAVATEGSRPAWQAYQILHVGFTAAPILAGIDKFFHLLCNWDQYLAPWVARLSPVSGHTLMLAAGMVEAAAGVLVAIRPRLGAPGRGSLALPDHGEPPVDGIRLRRGPTRSR